jgi:hypothetical protein
MKWSCMVKQMRTKDKLYNTVQYYVYLTKIVYLVGRGCCGGALRELRGLRGGVTRHYG